MMNLKRHINLALGYFIFAAVLGVVLRSFHLLGIPINYKFIVHTHSHIALLGWVYMAIATLLYRLYLQSRELDKKYRRIFWFTQITLGGMLVTFPFQGYALFSIIFSTLFLIASYWFTWFFLNNVPNSLKKANSYKCIKYALWYMVVSSLGPWILGGVMNTLGAASIWYRLAIYFYLHFQYNGWMIFALMGVLFYVFEQNDIQVPQAGFKRFFWSMNMGIVLTFFLSTLWLNPPAVFFIMGGLGAILQIIAFTILFSMVFKLKSRFYEPFTSFQISIFKTVAFIFGVKIMLQLISSIPYFSNLAAIITDFTIGYLHWTFLGVVTIGLFLFLDYFEILKLPQRAYLLYVLGFVGTEALIFYKGITAWQGWPILSSFSDILAMVSLLIPIGLILILGFNLKPEAKET